MLITSVGSSCSSLLFSYTVVDVEFAQPSYTVGENDGSVSVCIDISGAVLERNVTVFLSTEGFDATCKLLLNVWYN